ncbi:Enhancer of mRNA-decapping protein 3 [Lasiodiplodia theobromae]|uniref:Enhancer of mRNA-decapping protein 3 n=1 Tax=Lasiodiplodia theobromae TaxID=45133 RepID=A0A5N5DNE8_9PEZI|nr:Enhancer of mRNA-decapping protein 3 [Lasiodiplodia theobromae]
MAAQLIGIAVFVTLKDAQHTVVQGRVANVVEQTATLVLQDVFFPATGHRLPGYTIDGAHIADISVQPLQSAVSTPTYPPSHPPAFPPHPQHIVPTPVQYGAPPPPAAPPVEAPAVAQAHPAPAAEPPKPKPKQTFVDPAILSFGKRPTAASQAAEAPTTPMKPAPAAAVKKASIAGTNARPKEDPATLTRPFNALGLEAGEDGEESDDPTVNEERIRRASISKTRTGKPLETPAKAAAAAEAAGKRAKKGGARSKKQQKKEQFLPAAGEENAPDSSPEGARKMPANYKGKGWRQTPILQDPPATRTPGLIGGKVGMEAVRVSNRKTRRQKAMEATNGWATEDATDVQELPDFDFAENLSKFDKRTVFEQIRNEDTTADEDRLVSFNRLPPRAGTAGGKNLHPTENVLEQRRSHLRSNSNSSSEDDFSDFDSGRNSRRNMSRASNRRAPFRSNSVLQDDIHNTSAASLNKSVRNQQHRGSTVVYSSTNSPVPGRPTPPSSPSVNPLQQPHASFRVAHTGTTCHTITPGTMTAVEELAEVEFGLTEEIMAENAARGIAQVALQAVNPGGRRLARENLAVNARPVVVVLAGNHRTGARAIAAARHLHARGPRVVVALLGYERPADYDKDVRRQLELLVRLGGYARSWTDVQRGLKRLEAPPELIVDALLGRNREFDALGAGDRATAMAVVGWANKSRAQVLAVEGPSGVGASTGEVSIIEGEPLEVRAKYVVCLGAPRSGLLRALQLGHVHDPDWLIWVVDLGLNKAWKRVGGLGRKGVRFGSEWAVQVRFDAGEGETEGLEGR